MNTLGECRKEDNSVNCFGSQMSQTSATPRVLESVQVRAGSSTALSSMLENWHEASA